MPARGFLPRGLRQLDLFGQELLAVDGTRIKAVNNKDRNFTRATLTQFIKAADAKLDDYLQRLATRLGGVRSLSPTPTAERWRPIRMSRWATTCRSAVDAKHKLIVEQQVTNQVVDMGLLAQTAEPAKEVLDV
jgi:hypothetical protein